tara:strand:- start:1 stop:495 length:495 start_codon:yes stop_codon:yes gene_type:complete
MNKAKKKKQVAVEPLQEPPGTMLPCEPAAPPVETFEERVVRATRSFSPEKTKVIRLCVEYGERNEICVLIHKRKRQHYIQAKALKRTMSAIRRQQNLVPKARTKKQLAERKADEEQLATIRKEYHACGPEWLRANAYRVHALCRYGNARIARLERLLRDAGGEW